ncbi:MAG: glucuronyl hydrolase, partial [Candidatus Latescibacteria bacterium]|nr:glucuronyl hydrolase [Candidatus Latescibacterota bacterium]
YRETQNPEMLEAAQKVADYFIKNLPDDYVPYWDFNAPDIPREIRDSSAASIAASGLLELCTVVEEPADMDKYFTAAGNILISLCSPEYLAQGGDSYGLLSHATWKKPTDPQADTSLIWGDYYFLEALHRYVKVVRHFQ